jgi:cell division protein FtsL
MTFKDKLELVRKIIITYFDKYKKVPRPALIHKSKGIPLSELYRIFAYLTNEGFLRREDEHYYISSKETGTIEKVKEAVITQIEKVKEIPKQIVKTKFSLKKLSEITVRGIMFISAIICVFVSIFYSDFYLKQYLDPFIAIWLAAGFVLFGVLGPQALLLISRYKKTRFARVLLSFLALVIIAFSMLSTIVGQYNTRTFTVNENNKTQAEDKKLSAQYKLLTEEKTQFEIAIESREAEITLQLKVLSEISNIKITETDFEEKEDYEKALKTKQKNYNAERNKLASLRREKEDIQKALSKKSLEIKNFLIEKNVEIEKEKRYTIYIWLSKVIGWDADFIEFLFFMFPAIIVDILAPLGLYIALGLYKKQDKGA